MAAKTIANYIEKASRLYEAKARHGFSRGRAWGVCQALGRMGARGTGAARRFCSHARNYQVAFRARFPCRSLGRRGLTPHVNYRRLRRTGAAPEILISRLCGFALVTKV